MLVMVLDGIFHKMYERGLLGKVTTKLNNKKLTRAQYISTGTKNISRALIWTLEIGLAALNKWSSY